MDSFKTCIIESGAPINECSSCQMAVALNINDNVHARYATYQLQNTRSSISARMQSSCPVCDVAVTTSTNQDEKKVDVDLVCEWTGSQTKLVHKGSIHSNVAATTNQNLSEPGLDVVLGSHKRGPFIHDGQQGTANLPLLGSWANMK